MNSRRLPAARAFGLAAAAALALAACGYHLAGRNAALPESVRRIAVPPFENRTQQPEIAQRITENVAGELIARGGYVAAASPEGADAVLRGTVLSYGIQPVAVGTDGRATRYEIQIQVQAELRDVTRDAVLWKDDRFVFRRQYDVDPEEAQFFDRSIEAIEQVSRDFARSVVASILEGF